MLLRNVDTLVRQDDDRSVDRGVDVLVRDGRIAEIDDEIAASDATLDCSERIVLPGLVNCHAHTPGVLTRGWSDDRTLFPWLDATAAVHERADEDTRRAGARLSAAMLLATGTTTVNDMWNTYLAPAFEATGIRALLGCTQVVVDDTEPAEVEERLDAAETFVREYADHPTIHPTVPVHSVYRSTPDVLRRSHDIATEHDVPYHVHVSETREENEDCRDAHGTTPTGLLDDLGVLDERGVLAHCVHLSDADRERIADSGAGVAHCPSANAKLGSGVADLPALDGVPIGLGTDGAASNNALNPFREARVAALLQKQRDPGALTAQRALDAVTREAAAVLGLSDEIGSVEVGKRADLVLLDRNDPTLRPHFGDEGLVSNLVYSFHGRADAVLVEGEVVVEDGSVVAGIDGAADAVQAFCDDVTDDLDRPGPERRAGRERQR